MKESDDDDDSWCTSTATTLTPGTRPLFASAMVAVCAVATLGTSTLAVVVVSPSTTVVGAMLNR
jgi:hypothetical protein